ncbi:hypothetical protein EVAR_29022_1 [Eumeta japonica]|nr:hypothetical protein EVAR_29022_1 [Eumeta japonica]
MCNISKSSARGALLQQCKLIVWDECTMSHKRAIEALDRCLQDIQSNRKLMGGVVVLLAGILDRLYLLSRGTAADEISACLKHHICGPKLKSFILPLTCEFNYSTMSSQEHMLKTPRNW